MRFGVTKATCLHVKEDFSQRQRRGVNRLLGAALVSRRGLACSTGGEDVSVCDLASQGSSAPPSAALLQANRRSSSTLPAFAVTPRAATIPTVLNWSHNRICQCGVYKSEVSCRIKRLCIGAFFRQHSWVNHSLDFPPHRTFLDLRSLLSFHYHVVASHANA